MVSPHFLQPKKVLKNLEESHPQFLNDTFCDPYSGCEFGCLYCYGLKEEIIDQEKDATSPYRVGIKTSCAYSFKNELLAQKSAGESEKKIAIGFGFATDPYQPCEEQYQLTQRCLEIAKDQSLPIQILTKSELVLRDKGILSELSQQGLCVVSVSLFTTRTEIADLFEPRVPSPQKRLELIQNLRAENIVCGAHLMPIFPYLTDSEEELDSLFSQLKSHGALYGVPGILSLAHPPVQKRVTLVLQEKFSRTLGQYEALYDNLGRPALNYCERIEKIFNRLSEKYSIPLTLPVQNRGKQSFLVKDS